MQSLELAEGWEGLQSGARRGRVGSIRTKKRIAREIAKIDHDQIADIHEGEDVMCKSSGFALGRPLVHAFAGLEGASTRGLGPSGSKMLLRHAKVL